MGLSKHVNFAELFLKLHMELNRIANTSEGTAHNASFVMMDWQDFYEASCDKKIHAAHGIKWRLETCAPT